MLDEIFRFTVLRPPQRYSYARTGASTMAAYSGQPSQLALKLLALPAREAAAESKTFIDGNSYVATLDGLELPLAQLDRALLPPSELSNEKIAAAILCWFNAPAASVVANPRYKVLRERLADSLLAASLTDAARARGQEVLVRGLQLCGAIEAIAQCDERISAAAALRAMVVLPKLGTGGKTRTAGTELAAQQKERVSQLQQAGALRAATEELKRISRRKRMKHAALGPVDSDAAAKLPPPDRLQKNEIAALSAGTREVFTLFELPPDNLYLPAAIQHLESYLNVELGGLFMLPPWVFTPGGPAVPGSVGRARIAGINDLLVVRQRIRRYELGEIAHIENVMRGESYGRLFRRKDASEVLEEEETERTESLERDLQTTSKFELKTEAERTIQEDLKFEAGVSVTASGPGIEVGANAGFEYARSTEESAKIATTFARDVIDRSVSKLQERELKRRSTRTTREVEETTDHKMNNTEGSGHVVGVYRWVDKVYEAQVVNYGQRLILEFVLIEPAAFYRNARANRRVPGVQAELPSPPQFLDAASGRQRPLAVDDLTEGNYLNWVTQYAVSAVNPPPAKEIFISTALEQGAKTPPADSVSHALTTGSLNVDEGYQAQEIVLEWAGESDTTDVYWEVIVGTYGFVYRVAGPSYTRSNLRRTILDGFNYNGDIPVSMVVKNFGAFTVNITVRCELTEAKLMTWKLATFNSIMTRYSRLKADYEDQLAAAQVQQGVPISGNNPLANRETERNELRRQSIAMITGQNFELFNAMTDSGSPLRYPQVNDFREAQAEGDYVQFFEQALEWRYMTYLFYPYFWGNKASWTEVLNQQEDDPLFAQFLRAGAARVQVPVRPGFESAVDFFLKRGRVWRGGEPPTFEDSPEEGDPPFIPMFQELQEQSGLEFVEGPGSVTVSNGSATVRGTGTQFAGASGADLELNRNREIRLAGRDYRIREVLSATELVLATAFSGDTADLLPYGLGPRLVGQPWDVRLPTSLVMLQGTEAQLNPSA